MSALTDRDRESIVAIADCELGIAAVDPQGSGAQAKLIVTVRHR